MPLRRRLRGEDDAAVKAAAETLSQSQTKLGEALYSQEGEEATESTEAPAEEDEDIVDAEVVEDETDDTTDKK